ncbi:hypothetical protein F5Y17DRAFT_371594 [Xylariaceae sp. FL0594]|nr:hypothetical protein F5Y17DRAFT_371594 [Xylariaceae sp. FL0594]
MSSSNSSSATSPTSPTGGGAQQQQHFSNTPTTSSHHHHNHRSHKSKSKSKSKSRSHRAPPDTIDALDNIDPLNSGPYHHEGPYDAALPSRNRDPRTAPLEAVREGNREALRATPAVNVYDAVTRHVPLQGVAAIPPGELDYGGNVMEYEEGADLMREETAPGGPYKRWEGLQYHPDDLKGKGEPSFTIERDLKMGKKYKD